MIDFKIILCGEYGAGKTSLTVRLLRKDFNNYSPSTIGASFITWNPDLVKAEQEPQRVNFGIWDTAGQERFNSLLPMYLRNADAVFFCWDYTIPFDIFTANAMYVKAKDQSPYCHFYLVHTKIDKDQNFTPCAAAEEWVEEKQLEGHFYTSSLTGDGVQDLFINMAKNLLKNPIHRIVPETIKVDKKQRSLKNCCYR